MVYCKWCGMESSDPAKCSWCGRALVQAAPAQPAPSMVRSAGEVAEVAEEAGCRTRLKFFICCGALILLASFLIFWRYPLYPVLTLGSLFVAGVMLGTFGVVPPFEDEWVEIGVPLLLLLIFPALLVYLGYLIYGLVTREMDLTIVWLLSVYFGMLVILQVVTIIAAPALIPASLYWRFHAVEFLGLAAIGFGWISSSWFRSLAK